VAKRIPKAGSDSPKSCKTDKEPEKRKEIEKANASNLIDEVSAGVAIGLPAPRHDCQRMGAAGVIPGGLPQKSKRFQISASAAVVPQPPDTIACVWKPPGYPLHPGGFFVFGLALPVRNTAFWQLRRRGPSLDILGCGGKSA